MRIKIEFPQHELGLVLIHMDHDPPKRPTDWVKNALYDDLADILGGIRGIEKFYPLPYKVAVQKAEVFPWEEILPRVVDGLCEFFNDYVVEVEEHAELVFNTEGQIK